MASFREIERIRKVPAEFRALAQALLAAGLDDVTEWEADFLESVLRKPDKAEAYSLRQGEKLLEIRDGRIAIDTVRGFSVTTLIRKCYDARLDLSEDDEEWIIARFEAHATAVKRRDAARLLRCAEQLYLIDRVPA